MNELRELPFYGLEDRDFMKALGSWVYHSSRLLTDSRDLFQSVIENPEKGDELNMNTIESKYYNIKQSGAHFQKVSTKGFSILCCNTRSLPKNLCLLNDILLTVKEMPSVIAISETKLSDNGIQNISIPGYEFIGQNSKTNAGGTGLYIKDNIKFIRRPDLEFSSNGLETCFVELPRAKQKSVIIGCIYRHPHNDRESFLEIMRQKLEYLNSQGFEAYISGDININFFSYNTDRQTSDYLDMLLNLGYMPMITKATRITNHSATLIDHIYTNSPEKVIKSGICLADISDHLPCFCTVSTKLPAFIHERYYRDFSHFDKDLFEIDLANIDFYNLVQGEDVNVNMNNIANALQEITNKHAPIRQVTNSKKRQLKKPWISNGILNSIKRKQKLFKSHFLSHDPAKVKFYKAFNNKLNKIKQIAKQNYFTDQFNINKDNIKTTWKLIGMIINRKRKANPVINKLLYNNKCYTDKLSICEQLNAYFINVGPSLSSQLPNYDNINPTKYIHRAFSKSFMFRSIHDYEVFDLIINLKSSKSTIGTPVKCIKLACNHIYQALGKVYNQSLEQGIVPDILKLSKVTPIDKGGDISDAANFRPISTLSAFTQILEKLVYKQLINYIEKYSILCQFQFGFRKGRSTEQAIAEITDNLKKAIDNNLFTCGVFLDFAKAFDTVNHNILLTKMEKYGIRGLPLQWFTNYLTNRQQYVSMDGTESSKQKVVCGIPQGSSLGPLLFLIYINDIPNCSEKLSFRIFADDTNIFISSSNSIELETLVNQEILKVKEWCDINKLTINLKKTNYMIIKSSKKEMHNTFDIKILNNDGSSYSLIQKDHIKYLGVLIDDTISWKHHISFICSRISRNSGIFLKLRHYISLQQLKQLYYNLIYPYLSYAVISWGSAYTSHLKKIQVKQNHIIRVLFFATLYGKSTESALPLMNLLDILTVENIFTLQLLKFSHQWHKKQLPSIFDEHLHYASDVHSYNTRYAAKGNFYKARFRTSAGKKTTSALAVDCWRQLPTEMKNLSNFKFSKKVKQYLLSKQN